MGEEIRSISGNQIVDQIEGLEGAESVINEHQRLHFARKTKYNASLEGKSKSDPEIRALALGLMQSIHESYKWAKIHYALGDVRHKVSLGIFGNEPSYLKWVQASHVQIEQEIEVERQWQHWEKARERFKEKLKLNRDNKETKGL